MSAARPPRVAVTRPAAQAGDWVARLQGAGIDAFALPLIEIAPVAEPAEVAALATAWAGIDALTLVMFVSPNAVLHFFAARPAGTAWPAALTAAAPGPGTSDALRAEGLAPERIVMPSADATQFDSEALWERLSGRDWHGARVLVVRGAGGRDWLADRLAEAGASVSAVNAYTRSLPSFTGPERAVLDAAIAPGASTIWLLSSSQAVDHLERAAGAGRWGEARAVATHPRIAARARAAGFGEVAEAGAGLAAVVACIQSMRP